MSDLFEQDALARDRIVRDISSNFFVEAGAGSGKTTVLVKRMVAMVESGIDVSKICAITFTRAAAGEFYRRFQKTLIERSTAEAVPGAAQGKSPARRASRNSSRRRASCAFISSSYRQVTVFRLRTYRYSQPAMSRPDCSIIQA